MYEPNRIMVVEDSRTQAERLRQLLEREGWEVVHASTAEGGLDKIAGARPDLIVVDYHLPGMNGGEFCREIRMNVNTRSIPVLMLTVEGTDAAELRGLDSGADDYLAKSVDPDILILRIRSLLRSSQASEAIFAPAGTDFRRARVLAIGDSPTYLEYLAEELRSEGYQLTKSPSGREALNRLEQERFDCVIVDLGVHISDGLEVCRRLSARSAAENAAALVLIGVQEDKERITQALEAGADDFIGKSTDAAVLKSRVRAVLRRKFYIDENRRILEELQKKELEAVRARAEKEAVEMRAKMAGQLAEKNRELQEANRRLKSAFDVTMAITEHAAEALFLMDPRGRVTYMNPAAERMFGFPKEEMVGAVLHDKLHYKLPDGSPAPFEDCPLGQSLISGITVMGHDDLFYRRDGATVDVVCSNSPIVEDGSVTASVLVVHDNSERKRSEERLRQTQKLESVGLLAGGIAHDFNNLLTGVLGNASLALDEVPEASKPRLEAVILGAQKAADLTRQLLAYAGKGQFFVQPTDLSNTVHEITGLLRLSVPKTIQMDVELAADLPCVLADEGQMQQIVMNLVINASEAIGEEAHGVIRVSTSPAEISEPQGDGLGGQIPPGRYASVTVGDTGCGMDEATKARMFDPFFTTKFMGRGLGMAAVAGIVRAHGGAILVDSAPGQGARIQVLLPAAESPAAEGESEGREGELRGVGTILVVDDEEPIRVFIEHVLNRAGFSVLLASNGRDAVELLEHSPRPVDLVILDVVMPVTGGGETLARIRAIDPDIKVLLSTACSREEVQRIGARAGAIDFIQKPYTAQALAAKVGSIIRHHGNGA